MSEARPRRRWRWGCWCCGILLVPLVVGVAWLAVRTARSGQQPTELERLQRAGEPLKLSQFVPKIGKGEANAAPIYEQAFALAPKDITGPTGHTLTWDAEDVARAKRLVAENPRYYALLDRASRTSKCAFNTNWDAGPDLQMPQLARFREAARALEAKSEVQWRAGDIDGAVNSCITSLRISDHALQPPTTVGYLSSSVVQFIALKELERALSAGAPSPAACRVLYGQLSTRMRLDPFRDALRAERAWGLSVFDSTERAMQSGKAPSGAALPKAPRRDLPLTTKLLLARDKEHYLAQVARSIAALRAPFPQARTEMRANERAAKSYTLLPAVVSEAIMFRCSRALLVAYRAMATAGAAQLALAAKAYKAKYGAYPASLDDLARDGWKVPLDPFINQPYHYRREGPGFAVWSVGPDLTDSHAKSYDPKVNKDPDKPGYDFVFRCAR